MSSYPKRLIEVDLPIAAVSLAAVSSRRKKKGNLNSLHMWWARRPLAACRAVTLATLWPDPVDLVAWADAADPSPEQCEAIHTFLSESRQLIAKWATIGLKDCDSETYEFLTSIQGCDSISLESLQKALIAFVGVAANDSVAAKPFYAEAMARITKLSHAATGGVSGSKPLVIDPFAGGGSFPIEALRVGADVYASDLNPVPVILNRLLVEQLPRFGNELASRFRVAATRFLREARATLKQYYPSRRQGEEPIVYFWARTLRCEGPDCGCTIPLLSRLQITKRQSPQIVAVPVVIDDEIRIEVRARRKGETLSAGTARGGTVTCPACGFAFGEVRYRQVCRDGQLGETLYAVADRVLQTGARSFRSPLQEEIDAFAAATKAVETVTAPWSHAMDTVPGEEISKDEPRRLNIRQYGFTRWGQLFNSRQALTLVTLGAQVEKERQSQLADGVEPGLADAVATALAISVSNLVHYQTNMCMYLSDGMISLFIQSSAIPMRADYAEANPLMKDLVGGLEYQLERSAEVLEAYSSLCAEPGVVHRSPAQEIPLPSNSADVVMTDPPYYFSIPYADLSDVFYVWLRRFCYPMRLPFLQLDQTPKTEEATQSLPHSKSPSLKDKEHYERVIGSAFAHIKDIVREDGIGVVVFAHASTDGWEAIMQGLVEAGWMITATWPIDTENVNRMLASRQRTLASSVHLVCRPRREEFVSGDHGIGDWQDVLAELPKRIRAWMPRLAEEHIYGADAIFACLGPALEVFTRYRRVEKASGDAVPLRTYLEHVWAAVASEALSMIFEGADATELEPDARLTAMWLWTLGGGGPQDVESSDTDERAKTARFDMEFDAARKIAQGLGVHLENSESIVEVKGDKARLLPVSERVRGLFGKDATEEARNRGRKKKTHQPSLFEELEAIEAEAESGGNGRFGGLEGARTGSTVLDTVHQSMILFASNRSEALRRFLVDDGIGRDGRFWKLAQALSALYPSGTDEKRWVDGVLARKKGLGL